MKYTKHELENMPLTILRGLDISTPQEEAMVQSIIDERFISMPLETSLNIPASFTDNLTPEKERELQIKIDAKIAKLKGDRMPKVAPVKLETATTTDPIVPIEQTEPKPEVTHETPVPTAKKNKVTK